MLFNAKKMTAGQIRAFKRSQVRRGLAVPERPGECAVIPARRGGVDKIVCREQDGYYFNRPSSATEKIRRRVEADLERRRRKVK